MSQSLTLDSAEATEAVGRALAQAIATVSPESLCIYLDGELGAGKTTLVRGFLRGFGHAGRVPSPTYTLVEPYECGNYRIAHLDLYRLQGGAELEFLGMDELGGSGSLLLIEWPSRANDSLPASDIRISLKVNSNGRDLSLEAQSLSGAQVLEFFKT